MINLIIRSGSLLATPFKQPGASSTIAFQGFGIFSDLSTFFKKTVKSFQAESKWKIADHGARAVERFGSSLVRCGFLLVAAKVFVSAGSRAAAVMGVAIPVFVGIGVGFSACALFIDARNIYKIYTFKKEFSKVRNDWEESGTASAKDVAHTALIQLIENSQAGVIRKAFGVEQVALKTLLENQKKDHPSQLQVNQMFNHLGNRISAQMDAQVLNVAIDITSLISSVLLIIPITQPAGYVFFMLSLGGSFYAMKYEAKDAYDFQHKIGLINSPYGPSKSFKEFLFDKYGITALLKALRPEKKAPVLPLHTKPLHIPPRRFSTMDHQSLQVRYA